MSTLDHPAIATVAAALREAGQHAAADGIRILPAEVRTAALAAEALGVEVGAIANSLVFRAVFDHPATPDADVALSLPDRPLLALTSGAHRADTTALARLAGARHVAKADAAFVRRHTGQAIGGVAPTGHPNRLTTLVDSALADYDAVWAAAGHAKAVYPTTFAGLLALTGGKAGELGEPRQESVR
jgi:prolyl-tRNA editing enzyme YbaK/EbsC (Cys-tRNA(Pro) deacylase)